MTVRDELYPEPDSPDGPHDDAQAAEMHRLRGLVMAQASETEEVLGLILRHLDPAAKITRPAGTLLRDVRSHLSSHSEENWADTLDLLDQAIKQRNHAAHNTVTIGSVWRDYATGGGEYVPVISLLGTEEYSETDLIDDLALQQQATAAAVRLLHSLR